MYGENPDQYQGQYERQQRASTEGGRQFESTQWQQPRGERMQQPQGRQLQQPQGMQPQGMQQPQGQQYGASGTQQAPTRQPTGPQQGMQGQQGTSQRGRQTGTQGQQGMQRQQGMGQQGMQRQQGMGQQGMQRQQGMGQQGMQRQQGMAQGTGSFHSTRGFQLQSVTLEEISRSEVVTVQPDDTITDVVVEMADKDVGSVVVAEDGEPKGVLTDRKIALTLGEMPDVADRTAGDLVSGGVVTGTPGMSIYEAVQKLRDEGIRRLPIVDERGRLEGIVTLDDIVVLIAGELGAAAEVIERQAPPR